MSLFDKAKEAAQGAADKAKEAADKAKDAAEKAKEKSCICPSCGNPGKSDQS